MIADPVLSVADMRAAERAAMDGGISEWELMERAGHGAAQWVARMAAGRSVAVLCGPGNNGGDGYVIAAYLLARGHDVTVVAPVEPKTETAARARAGFEGRIVSGDLPPSPVVVDCLFGYGLDRAVEGPFADLLESLRSSDRFKVAIDVPSAIASDTGEVLGPLPRYDLTLALGAWKRAHGLMPAMASMGSKRLVPIGLEVPEPSACFSRRPHLAPPAPDSHKYKRGLLTIVAGAMPGAPLLAAEAAMRSGPGYVKLLSDHSHPDAPADLVIDGGELSEALGDERIDAILIGPGLGRDATARERLTTALAAGRPLVLDADALHLVSPEGIEGVETSLLCVTPHEGELQTLCKSFGITADEKLAMTQGLHEATGMTVLAKGPDTVLVGRGGPTRFFSRGSSWLSTAGTGDVLAGLVAGRLAHHGDPLRACEEGVWLHHEAARRAGAAFTARDLALSTRAAFEALS